MNKKDSKIIKKSKKLNKSKKVIKNTKSTKSIKDKSVKQHVNVNVSSSGSGGSGGSTPHPFLNASSDKRGEDVLLKKLSDLIISNNNIIRDPTPPIIDKPTTPINDFTDVLNNPNSQIPEKVNDLFDVSSSNIIVETKPNTNNESLLESLKSENEILKLNRNAIIEAKKIKIDLLNNKLDDLI